MASGHLRGGNALVGLRVTFADNESRGMTEGTIKSYNNALKVENTHPFCVQLDDDEGREYINLPDEKIIFYEELRAVLRAQSNRTVGRLDAELVNLRLREKYSHAFVRKLVIIANTPMRKARVSYMEDGQWHEGKVETLDPFKERINATITDMRREKKKPFREHLPSEKVIFYHELRAQMRFQTSDIHIAEVGE